MADMLKNEVLSALSEESAMRRLYSKTSFYPVTSAEKPSSPLTNVNSCSCGERPVTWYCKTDDALFCKPCKYENHARCHVEKIESVAKGSLDCKELDRTIREFTTLKYVFQKMKENKRLKKLQHRQEKTSMLKLSKRWNMLQSTRIALKKEVELGLGKYEEELEEREKVMVRKSRWVVLQVNEYLNELNDNLQKQNEAGVFVILYRAKKDLKEFRNILNEITEDQNHGDIFEGLKTMVTGIYHCENEGNVLLARTLRSNIATPKPRFKENSHVSTPSERSKSSYKLRKNSPLSSASRRLRPVFRPQAIRMATLISSLRSRGSSRALTRTSIALKNPIADRLPKKEFSLYSSSDRLQDYQVSAMCALSDGKLLVLDNRNNMLKLFSSDDVFITDLSLGCSVWDFAPIARFEILITCPSEGKLQRVKITAETRDWELEKTGYILTQKDCRAIRFVGSRIYISYTGKRPCIKILSKDGIMYRSVEAYKGSTTLFTNPLYMHVTKLGKLIYVSDFSLQRVVKIDQKGNLHEIIDLSPGWPLGLSMIKEEKLIVAVSGTNDIKMITRGRLKWLTVIGPRALEGNPCAITVKETTNGKQPKQLYVAYAGRSAVKVFSMV